MFHTKKEYKSSNTDALIALRMPLYISQRPNMTAEQLWYYVKEFGAAEK